jgi:hypothetical protein
MSYFLTLVVLDIFTISMQKAGDCDFFVWADREMSSYEKGLVKYLREMEEKKTADNDRISAYIREKCIEQYDILRRDLESWVKMTKLMHWLEKNARNIMPNYGRSLGCVKIIRSC